jgi:pimeloyl-ACP methyl ester carboxylesterase
MLCRTEINRQLCRVLLVSIFVLSLSATALGQEQKPLQVKTEPYTLKLMDGKEVPAEIGRFTVPEKRSNPTGKTVDLAFVRLKSTAPNPGHPTVILAGGPGGSGIAEAAIFYHVFQALLGQVGDVIAFEQRGTGRSKPRLGCSETTAFAPDALATRENMLRYLKEAFRPCAETWRKQGVDLTAYNTAESADDVEDLRKVLGVEKINLWGFSYGTHLGLAFIKRHPTSVNKAILAGVEGLDDTRKLPSKIDKHLEDINRLVKADPELSKTIPDFLVLMKKVFDQLEKQPVKVEIVDRRTKQKMQVMVGKFALQFMTGIGLGDSKDISRFPALYYATSRGDLTLLTKEVQDLQNRMTAPAPWAMTFSMDCASGATRERDRRIMREAKRSLIGDAINFPWPHICDVWGNPDVGDQFRTPLKSNVPVLLISGTLDGRTPISNSQEILRGLPKGKLFVVEGAAHEDVYNPPATTEAILEFMKTGSITVTRTTHPPLKFASLTVK